MLAGQVAASIQQHRPAAVFSHGSNGEYGHPGHLLMHQAVSVAIASLGAEAPLLYTVHAAYPAHPRPRLANQDDPAHFVLDISSVRAVKVKAAAAHKTQNALFVRRPSQEAGHPVPLDEAILPVESFHRAHPAAPAGALPEDAITAILKPYIKPL